MPRFLLFLILAGALSVRLVAAFYSVGYDHPNEFGRLLEPIAHFWGFSANLPWEWSQGLLFEWPLRLQALVFRLFGRLGANDILLQSVLMRCVYGFLSLAPVYFTSRWLTAGQASRGIVILGTATLAFWPEIIYRSVRLMDYSLEASITALGAGILLWSWKKPVDGSKPWVPSFAAAFWGGAVLGLAFFVRYQSGLFFVGAILALILWARKDAIRPIAWLSFGYAFTIFLGASVEWAFFRKPETAHLLSPFFNYFIFNAVEGGAALHYGTQPWHRFISEAAKFYGFGPALIFIYFMFRNRGHWPLVVWALVPLIGHSLIAHKEGRFLFGSLWVWVPAAFLSLRFYTVKQRRGWALVLGLVWLVGLGINGRRIEKQFLLNAKDVREFAEIGQVLRIIQKEEPSKVVRKLPTLRIEADPVFNPGAFFLRYRGPVCFNEACPADVEHSFMRVFRDPAGIWILERQDEVEG